MNRILFWCYIAAIMLTTSCDHHRNDQIKPQAPTILAVSRLSGHELNIIWQNPEHVAVEGIVLSRKVGEEPWNDHYQNLPSGTAGFSDYVELIPGRIVAFRLRVYTVDDTSDFSEIHAYIDSTCRPTEVCGRQIDGEKFVICWRDNSIGEEGFAIDKKIGYADWISAYQRVDANHTEFVDRAGSSRDSVAYRISAVAGSSSSLPSPVVRLKLSSELSLENLYFGSANSFEVLTWNIENFPKRNGATITSLARAVKSLHVDLIALQEIESGSDFLTLVDSLSEYLGFRASSAYGDINLAYLYNVRSFSVDTIYEIYREENAFPRSPLVLRGCWQTIPVIVINNHYKAYDDDESRERRAAASELLVHYIQTNFPDDRVVVLGDLNDELTDNQYSNVFLPFLNLPQDFKFADMSIALGSSANWSYPTWPSHIDHIIITNELFGDFTRSTTVVTTLRVDDYFASGWNNYETTISDHRPVGLKMVLTNSD